MKTNPIKTLFILARRRKGVQYPVLKKLIFLMWQTAVREIQQALSLEEQEPRVTVVI